MKLLIQSRNGSPLFTFAANLSCRKRQKNSWTKYTFLKAFYKNDTINWAFDENDFLRLGTQMISEIRKNPAYLSGILKQWKKAEKCFYDFSEKIAKTDFSGKTTGQLVEIFADFEKEYEEWWDIAMLVEPLDFTVPELLKKELAKIESDGRKVNEYFSKLSFIPEDSFMSIQEKEFLKILEKIVEKPELVEAARGKILAEKIEGYLEILAMVKEHSEKFAWINCNYFSQKTMSLQDFLWMIQAEITKKNPKAEIKKIEEKMKKTEEERKLLLDMLPLTQEAGFLIGVLEEFNSIHDERKKCQMVAFWRMGTLVDEIAKRKAVDRSLVLYLHPFEIKEFLEGKISIQKLEKRREFCFEDFDEEPFREWVGKEAMEKEKELLSFQELDVEEINGMCACSGKAIAKARVILSSKEAHALKEGEILVTGMTTPDFTPFMKRLAGIITDDGGITCHAAIVARELNIPCIVGTKVATKIFKTGDLVELKANHGIARKAIGKISKSGSGQ